MEALENYNNEKTKVVELRMKKFIDLNRYVERESQYRNVQKDLKNQLKNERKFSFGKSR